jgi:hypothetical protein
MKDIVGFTLKIGEIFPKLEGYLKISLTLSIIMVIPNMVFITHFYNGLNDDSKQVFDGSVGGVFMFISADQGRE